MKKCNLIPIICFMLFVSISTNLFAENKSLDGKLGTSYASDPEKYGFQLNFAYLTVLDPFFAIGFEPGIYWVNWDRKVGRQQTGGVDADLKADTNAYMIPCLADAQVRLPNLEEKFGILPYLTFGLGYSIMILDYSQPEYTNTSGDTVEAKSDTKLFHGLTWQIMIGAAYDPSPSSKIEFIGEIGYRGAKLKHDDLEIDMSGWVFNIGIRYPFGGAAPASAM